MSGGQGPYGPYGQSPYGQDPYGQDPYGQGGYGAPGPPYAHGLPAYPAPGGTREPRRPGAVTTAGVLTILAGSLGILLAVVVAGGIMLLGVFLGEMQEGKSPGSGDAEGVTAVVVGTGAVVGLVAIGLAVAHLLLGVRVLRGGGVARVVLTVWDALAVAALLVTTLAALTQGEDPAGVVARLVVGLPVPVAVLVCLWVPSASTWFAARRDGGQGPCGSYGVGG